MKTTTNSDTVIVLDFETTGLSPDCGDRAIEIGAVKLVNGEAVERFQQLMYPGQRISRFIEDYNGISNNMLKKAAPCEEVMPAFAKFIEDFNLVAHNASFDSRFLDAELNRVKCKQRENFACSMLIARRLYPEAPNHKLGTLVRYKSLPNDGTFHRALADAEMTAHLWLTMMQDIKDRHSFAAIPFEVMQKLARTSKQATTGFLRRESARVSKI
ncbi:MAG: 3'-5' exonuclease [Gammaproteobacteria bacterium]|jgi:DNA polymerase-3 subunit epsilon|nr:3'-5' exonuclease [Gammaproteobacteria bacterium]